MLTGALAGTVDGLHNRATASQHHTHRIFKSGGCADAGGEVHDVQTSGKPLHAAPVSRQANKNK
jgi:hypothetical protein